MAAPPLEPSPGQRSGKLKVDELAQKLVHLPKLFTKIVEIFGRIS